MSADIYKLLTVRSLSGKATLHFQHNDSPYTDKVIKRKSFVSWLQHLVKIVIFHGSGISVNFNMFIITTKLENQGWVNKVWSDAISSKEKYLNDLSTNLLKFNLVTIKIINTLLSLAPLIVRALK